MNVPFGSLSVSDTGLPNDLKMPATSLIFFPHVCHVINKKMSNVLLLVTYNQGKLDITSFLYKNPIAF